MADGSQRIKTIFRNGWWPTAPPVGSERIMDSIRDARNILVMPDGSVRSAKLIGSSLHASSNRLYLVNNDIGYIVDGSIAFFEQTSYWYVGAGPGGVGGTGPGGFAVSFANPAPSSSLAYYLNGTGYVAGLAAPTGKPGLILKAMATGKVTGSVSIQLTRRRNLTFAESNPSPSSDAVTGANSVLTATIPAAVAGQDGWGLYATFTGLGLEGPYFLYKDLVIPGDISALGGTYDFDYNNDELADINPPTNHNQPLQGLFCVSLSNIMIMVGVLGGTNIQPSVPNDPESYPFSTILVTTPPEVVNGVLTRPGENELTFYTFNSIQTLVQTGDPDAPILIRGRHPVAGVKGKNAICYAESDLYFASGEGLTRILDGQGPDTTFAIPVQKFIRDLGINSADIVVGYDQRYQHIVFFLGSSNFALVFNRQTENWSPPLIMPSMAISSVTLDGILKVTFSPGMLSAGLYDWEGGSGSAYWLQHNWIDDPDSADRKTIIGVEAVYNTKGTAATLDFIKDFSTTAVKTLTIPVGAGQTLKNSAWLLLNEFAYQYASIFRGTGADHELVLVEFCYLYEPGIRFVEAVVAPPPEL